MITVTAAYTLHADTAGRVERSSVLVAQPGVAMVRYLPAPGWSVLGGSVLVAPVGRGDSTVRRLPRCSGPAMKAHFLRVKTAINSAPASLSTSSQVGPHPATTSPVVAASRAPGVPVLVSTAHGQHPAGLGRPVPVTARPRAVTGSSRHHPAPAAASGHGAAQLEPRARGHPSVGTPGPRIGGLRTLRSKSPRPARGRTTRARPAVVWPRRRADQRRGPKRSATSPKECEPLPTDRPDRSSTPTGLGGPPPRQSTPSTPFGNQTSRLETP